MTERLSQWFGSMGPGSNRRISMPELSDMQRQAEQLEARAVQADHLERLADQAAETERRAVMSVAEPFTYSAESPHSYFADLARVATGRGDRQGAERRIERHRLELSVVYPAWREARNRQARLSYEAAFGGDRRGQELLERMDRLGLEHFRTDATLDRELRAASTTQGDGGWFAPPLWLAEQWAGAPRAGRPFANLWHGLPLPAGCSSINIPKWKTGIGSGPTVGRRRGTRRQPRRLLLDVPRLHDRRDAAGVHAVRRAERAARIRPVRVHRPDGRHRQQPRRAAAHRLRQRPAHRHHPVRHRSGRQPRDRGEHQQQRHPDADHGGVRQPRLPVRHPHAVADDQGEGTAAHPRRHPPVDVLHARRDDRHHRPPARARHRQPAAEPARWSPRSACPRCSTTTCPSPSAAAARQLSRVNGGGVSAVTDGNGTWTVIAAVRAPDLYLFEGEIRTRVAQDITEAGSGQWRFVAHQYTAALRDRYIAASTLSASGGSDSGSVTAGGATTCGVATHYESNSPLQPAANGF